MTIQDSEQLAARAIEEGAYEEALRLLLPLADHNSEYGLLSLGWIYETGVAGFVDKDAAQLYYQRAAAEGSAPAYLNLGWLLLGKGEKVSAQEAFEAGARLNSEECKLALSRLIDGEIEQLAARAIEDKNYERAVELLLPLADHKSEYALLTLGWIYETGATGTLDNDAARKYYEGAVTEGSAAACFELGRILLVQGKESQARSAFEAGAERGDVPSMSKLGRMMVEGRGGSTDTESGSAWLKSAAAQGHIMAQRTLLGIEERDAQSLVEKISVKSKIASLVKRGAIEMLKDPHSDKIR